MNENGCGAYYVVVVASPTRRLPIPSVIASMLRKHILLTASDRSERSSNSTLTSGNGKLRWEENTGEIEAGELAYCRARCGHYFGRAW